MATRLTTLPEEEIGETPPLKLTGQDGNAFMVMGLAHRAARRAGKSDEWIAAYDKDAMSGDYDNLLAVTMTYFDVS